MKDFLKKLRNELKARIKKDEMLLADVTILLNDERGKRSSEADIEREVRKLINRTAIKTKQKWKM